MRATPFIVGSTLLLLAACGAPKPVSISLQQRLANPLYAEYYFDDLVEHLVDLDIQNDPTLDDARAKSAADDARRDGLQAAKAATKKQAEGLDGVFIPAKDFAQGEVLLVDDMLFFHPQFLATPSPDIHVMLSESIDPRDGEFPDANAVDAGPLQSPYGDQSYTLPITTPAGEQPPYRSIVLWDATLQRIVGFAQMHAS